MNIINNFERIKHEIKTSLGHDKTRIIAVSKTYPIEYIMPLVDYGHRHFGENKVQEAEKNGKRQKKLLGI